MAHDDDEIAEMLTDGSDDSERVADDIRDSVDEEGASGDDMADASSDASADASTSGDDSATEDSATDDSWVDETADDGVDEATDEAADEDSAEAQTEPQTEDETDETQARDPDATSAKDGEGVQVRDPVTGEVIGTATWDAQNGRWVTEIVETTVVEESSTQDSPFPALSKDDVTVIYENRQSGGTPTSGYLRWICPPGLFQFEFYQADNKKWLRTKCLELRVVQKYDGAPIQDVPIFFVLQVLGTRDDGSPTDQRWAQVQAAMAASMVADRIAEDLNLGLLTPAQAPGRFRDLFKTELQFVWSGFRVFSCGGQ